MQDPDSSADRHASTVLRRARAFLGWRVPIAAGLVGFATFAISVGLPLVNPTRIGWLLYGGDPEVHFLGWHLFRNGPTTNPAGAEVSWSFVEGGQDQAVVLQALAFAAGTGRLEVVKPLAPGSYRARVYADVDATVSDLYDLDITVQ